jgi:hypothetical protein
MSRSESMSRMNLRGGAGAEGECLHDGGEVDREEAGGVVGHAGGRGFDIGGGLGEELEAFEEFAAELPFLEAAVAPVAEILFVNGMAVEGVAEEGLDFGEAVEPLGEDAGGDVAVHAMVYFFAEGAREGGDFSETRHGGGV